MNQLEGKKTYIVAGIVFILGGLKALGLVDEGIYSALIAFLLPVGLVTLRMGLPSKKK